jgi:hypothetical protein
MLPLKLKIVIGFFDWQNSDQVKPSWIMEPTR